MVYIGLLIIALVVAASIGLGFYLGKMYVMKSVHKVSDVFKPKFGGRSKAQLYNDKVMQLTNEIAKLKPLEEKVVENGAIELTMYIYVPKK